MSDDTNNTNQSAILKELSDIKSSLAVNTNETANIKSSITEIKTDIKEIKNDFITRREMSEGMALIREEIAPMKRIMWACISAVLVTIIGGIMAFFFTFK